MFSVGQIVEYSDLSPWEPAKIVAHDTAKGIYEIEFLDHDRIDVPESEVRELTWETLKSMDEQREGVVVELQKTRRELGFANDMLNTYAKRTANS